MKMLAIIVKQGFAVIVAFYYNFCLFKNPAITILKVVRCEDCERANKLPVWGLRPQPQGNSSNFFRKKKKNIAILTQFG